MPVYSFQLSQALAGNSVSVRAVGSADVVASGTLDANAAFTASLPVGDYEATAAGGHYSYRAAGTVARGDVDGVLTEGTADTAMATILGNGASESRTTLNATFAPGPVVSPPTGFALSTLPMPSIHRLGSGRFHADLDLQAMRPPAGATYYVSATATAGVGTGTRANPMRISEALAKTDVGTIVYLPGEYYRTESTTATTKSLNHLADAPGVRITGWNSPSIAWTLHTGSVYKTTRSATTQVVDVNNRTAWGDFTIYVKKADAASVTGPGQWAIVGSEVYVWAIGNTDLSNTSLRTQVRLSVSATNGLVASGGTHYLRGIAFEGCGDGGITINNDAVVIAEDCSVKYSTAPGGVTLTSGFFIGRRVTASSNNLDGFNYHDNAGGTLNPEFIEVDCVSHHNGLLLPGTNNATTAHEAIRGIRVGGDYDASGGPVVADVNSARTWNLGCRAGDSAIVDVPSYRVDALGYEGNPAVMWLDECTADTADYALRATGAGGTIHLHAFRYSNVGAVYPADAGTVDYYTPA